MPYCVNCGNSVEEYDFFCVKCGFQVREKDDSSVLRTVSSKSPSNMVVFEPQRTQVSEVSSEPLPYQPPSSEESIAGSAWILGAIFLATFFLFTLFLLIPVFIGFSSDSFAGGIHSFGDFFATFGTIMGQIGGAIGEFFGNLGGHLGDFFGNFGDKLGNFFDSLFGHWDHPSGMHMDVMLFPLSLTSIFIILGILILVFSFVAHRRRNVYG